MTWLCARCGFCNKWYTGTCTRCGHKLRGER